MSLWYGSQAPYDGERTPETDEMAQLEADELANAVIARMADSLDPRF